MDNRVGIDYGGGGRGRWKQWGKIGTSVVEQQLKKKNLSDKNCKQKSSTL